MDRLASVVQEILGEAGCEAVPTLGGGMRAAQMTLVDPTDYAAARVTLRTAGYTVHRTSLGTIEVRPDDEKGAQGDSPEGEFEGLVSSWKKFAEKSSDNGYRKASRVAKKAREVRKPGYDSVSAAHQMARATLEFAQGNRDLRKLAGLLAAAAAGGDAGQCNRILGVLAGGPERAAKPVFRDPNAGAKAAARREAARREAAVRAADLKSRLMQSAANAIQHFVAERSDLAHTPRAVAQIGMKTDGPYPTWRSHQEAPDAVCLEAWAQAARGVAAHFAQAGSADGGMGVDHLVDSGLADAGNSGFAVASALDVVASRKQLAEDPFLPIVGSFLDGCRKPPGKITLADVRKFIASEYPKAAGDKLEKMARQLAGKVEKVVGSGIPRRD